MLSQALLLEYLHYDENTGHLTWIKRRNKRIHVGTRAGTLNIKSGYRQIVLFGKSYPEHRVIWCMVHGQMPEHQIDHINHKRDDNRITNLRQVTKAENSRNRTRRSGRVDEAGIWWNKKRKRYIAEITLNQKKVWQRSFTDINEAIQQRQAKLLELGFHKNHGEKS